MVPTIPYGMTTATEHVATYNIVPWSPPKTHKDKGAIAGPLITPRSMMPYIPGASPADLRHAVKGEFDLYAGTVGLADPDPEGAMSFYLEGDAPIIWSKGNDFLHRLDLARKESDSARLPLMRSILSDAVYRGYVLPLFHLSTLGLGKPELDFSGIPISDESVTLSKVLFKSAGK